MRSLLSPPTVTYCEQPLSGIIKRPWAALSNMAFFIAGIVILVQGRGSRLSKLFGGTALLVGVLSTMYDITYTYGSQLLDLSGMLIFVSLLLYLNLRAFGYRAATVLTWLGMAFATSLLAIISFGGHSGNIVFGLYVLAVIVTESRLLAAHTHRHGKVWLLALMLFAFGFLLWIPDNRQLFCLDIGLFNGRAVFHYLAATVMYLLYRFYDLQRLVRGEKQ